MMVREYNDTTLEGTEGFFGTTVEKWSRKSLEKLQKCARILCLKVRGKQKRFLRRKPHFR